MCNSNLGRSRTQTLDCLKVLIITLDISPTEAGQKKKVKKNLKVYG